MITTQYMPGVIKDFGESDDQRIVAGWASTPSEDREGDTIEPEAFAGSLGSRLKLLFNHQQDQPVGKIVKAEVRDAGLWIEGRIAKGTAKADEVWTLIEQKILDSFSVGFLPKEWEPMKKGDTLGPKRFTQAELLEVSIVTIPANPNAVMTGAALGVDAMVARHFAASVSDKAQEMHEMLDRDLDRIVAERVEKRIREMKQSEAFSQIDWRVRS